MISRVTNYFRPAFEAKAAVVWLAAIAYCGVLALILPMRASGLGALFLLALMMAALRIHQVQRLWDFKTALAGKAIQLLPASTLVEGRKRQGGLSPDEVWLGWGWRWERKHAQLAADILKIDSQKLYPPDWYLRLKGVTHDPRQAKGMQWIHGLDDETDIRLPFKALEGHTAVMAITGAMKTTLFKLLVHQIAERGDVLLVFDPKGDLDLKNICREVPASLGFPERFVMFHPAFPTQSMRFDAFAAWDRETQVASRIRMIMNSDGDDNFVSFVWMTVTNIVGCMRQIGQRASIVSLLEHVQSQSAVESLADKVLTKFLSALFPTIDQLVSERSREAENENKKPQRGKASQISSPRVAALVEFFKSEVPEAERPREITGLIAALEANREWFGKMIITLTPTLTKLSAGDLGPLLSPNYDDIEDQRPIFTSRKLIEGGYVAYFGLDALSDSPVAAAISAVALADVAGTAGEIYNHDTLGSGAKRRSIYVLIDEWGDAVCEPVIQLANKARGAGVKLILAGQTFSDLVVKLGGDKAMALRVMGNMNNLIVGATNDGDTLDMIQSKIGETVIERVSSSQGSGQKTEDAGLEYSANRGVSVSDQAADMVPRNLLMALPDLQYFAILNRAALYKGRIPVLTLGEKVAA